MTGLPTRATSRSFRAGRRVDLPQWDRLRQTFRADGERDHRREETSGDAVAGAQRKRCGLRRDLQMAVGQQRRRSLAGLLLDEDIAITTSYRRHAHPTWSYPEPRPMSDLPQHHGKLCPGSKDPSDERKFHLSVDRANGQSVAHVCPCRSAQSSAERGRHPEFPQIRLGQQCHRSGAIPDAFLDRLQLFPMSPAWRLRARLRRPPLHALWKIRI